MEALVALVQLESCRNVPTQTWALKLPSHKRPSPAAIELFESKRLLGRREQSLREPQRRRRFFDGSSSDASDAPDASANVGNEAATAAVADDDEQPQLRVLTRRGAGVLVSTDLDDREDVGMQSGWCIVQLDAPHDETLWYRTRKSWLLPESDGEDDEEDDEEDGEEDDEGYRGGDIDDGEGEEGGVDGEGPGVEAAVSLNRERVIEAMTVALKSPPVPTSRKALQGEAGSEAPTEPTELTEPTESTESTESTGPTVLLRATESTGPMHEQSLKLPLVAVHRHESDSIFDVRPPAARRFRRFCSCHRLHQLISPPAHHSTIPPRRHLANPLPHQPTLPHSQGRARPFSRTHARLAFQEGDKAHLKLLSTEYSSRYAGVPNAASVAVAISRHSEAVMDANEYACVAPTPKEHARFGE